MERFVVNFIRSSLVWLGVGVVLGVTMSLWPGDTLVYRPAHLHANLLGFVSMMIFGVAYHVIPRFTGNPLHQRPLAQLHLWLANLGLAAMVAGWMLRVAAPGAAAVLLPVGGLVNAAGVGLFIYNLWRTLPAAKPTASRQAPLVRFPAGAGSGR
jgi:cbb3-type cytochrome oxidase subunit 1